MILLDTSSWNFVFDPHQIIEYGGLILILAIVYVETGFLYSASSILIGAMIIMNLIIGVIMNSMEESQKELAQEINEIHYKEKGTEATVPDTPCNR